MNNSKFSINNSLEQVSLYYKHIQLFIGVVAFVLLFIPFPIPFVIYFSLIFVSFMFFLFLKDLTKNAFLIWRIVLIIYCLSLTERVFKGIEFEHQINIIFPIKFVVIGTVVMITSALLFVDNEKKQQYWDEINLLKLLSNNNELHIKNEKGEDTYDVILCNDERDKNPIIWHGLDRFLHMLILAPTGAGKTSQILLPLITQDIENNRGVIVIDPKSDLAIKTYSYALLVGRTDVQYFDPISPDCPYYNVLYGNETDVTEAIVTTFLTMESSSNASPYWGNMTENLLRKACMVVKRIEAAYTDPETGISSRPATLMTLNDLIQNTNNKGRDMVKELTQIPTSSNEVEKENIDTQAWFLDSYFAETSKVWQDTSNIRTEISRLCQNKYLKKILNPPDGISQVDFPKILKEGRYLSISLAQGKLGALAKVLSSFLILTMERAILNRSGTEWTRTPCFLYIDEFQVVANKGFSDILEQGRSYRVSSILATQTMAEIKKGADGEAFLHSVLANTRNKVALAGCHYEDAKYFETSFGTKKEWKISYSQNHQKYTLFSGQPLGNASEGERTQEDDVPFFPADEIVYQPFGTVTIQLVDDKTLQRPKRGKANFLDREKSKQIDLIVDEYNMKNEKITQETEERERLEQIERNREWLKTKSNPNKMDGFSKSKNFGNPLKANTKVKPIPNSQPIRYNTGQDEKKRFFNPLEQNSMFEEDEI